MGINSNAVAGRRWCEVFVMGMGWRNQAAELGISDVEGDAVRDAESKFLEDEFFGGRGSVRMPIEMLGASFLSLPVACGQWDDSDGRGIRRGSVIHLLGFGACLEEFDGLVRHGTEEELVEHGSPASVWTDGDWDEDPVGLQHVMIDLFSGEGGMVVWITMTIPSELLLLLLN